MKQWKTAGVYLKGKSHIKSEIPCQDRVYSLSKGNTYVIALSDGAGSRKHSQYGAEISTKIICKLLTKKFNQLYSQNTDKIAQSLMNTILKYIIYKAKQMNSSINDFASTLLFVAVKDSNYIMGHIGDGVIGRINNDGIEVLSHPDNGEYANQTYFITNPSTIDHFRINKGNIGNTTGFVLMSDGTSESLYDKKRQTLSPISKQMLEWLNTNDTKTVTEALNKNVSEYIIPRTTDDCSINLMKLVEPQKTTEITSLLEKIKDLLVKAKIFVKDIFEL